MSKSILRFILLSIVFLFSLAPIAGAQCVCEFFCNVPSGVVFAYKCQLDCASCPEGNPECKACDRLEDVFGGCQLGCCLKLEDCEPPPGV